MIEIATCQEVVMPVFTDFVPILHLHMNSKTVFNLQLPCIDFLATLSLNSFLYLIHFIFLTYICKYTIFIL